MASLISASELVNKAMYFLTTDIPDKVLRKLVQEAIIKADRELRNCDQFSPLAWDIVPYDGLRTSRYAEITDISAANPGVVTAECSDSSIEAHGFRDNSSSFQDIVLIDSLDEPEELNGRLFLLEYIDADTFSLKTLDGLSAIDTTNYTAYTSGGAVFHAGIVLHASTILTDVDSKWTIKRLLDVTFDRHPTEYLSEQSVRNNAGWTSGSCASRPSRVRYWQHITNPDTPTISHYLFWYPPAGNEHNIFFNYQKEIADISSWKSSIYPFHPAEVHDALWHGALANLAGDAKRMQRQSTKAGHVTKMEILFAEKWIMEWEKDKSRVRRYSRDMLGAGPGLGGMTA